MTSSDTHEHAPATQTHGDTVPPPTETAAGQGPSQVIHARTHTRCLTQSEAMRLAWDVAGLLAEEQSLGSFGVGETATVDARLSGACCIAAAVTTTVLVRRGVPARVAGGRARTARVSHWWAESHDGWILDPTFGQFALGIDPLVVHVSMPESLELHCFEKMPVEDFMSRRDHPSLPAENKNVVDRLLARLTGAPYAW